MQWDKMLLNVTDNSGYAAKMGGIDKEWCHRYTNQHAFP